MPASDRRSDFQVEASTLRVPTMTVFVVGVIRPSDRSRRDVDMPPDPLASTGAPA
jgi:hypothetical protein